MRTKQNINKFKSEILKEIHNNIYMSIKKEFIDIFLCGGVSSITKKSVRDQIRDNLKGSKYLRILYPEDLFMEILGRNRESNLLTLENFLANNSDYICIVCESSGALVELGAFSNHEKVKEKLIIAVDEKKRKEKSFMMLGPVKFIQKEINKDHVIFYEKDNVKDLSERLEKQLRKNKVDTSKKISSLIGLYYFIPLMLFFFDSFEVEEMEKYVRFLFKELDYSTDELKITYNSAIRLNFKEKRIKKNHSSSKNIYELTNIGYESIEKNIFNKSKKYDEIRLKILKNRYY